MAMAPLETHNLASNIHGVDRQRYFEWITLFVILTVTLGLLAVYIYVM